MFLPVKADFHLPRFPFLTVLICVICTGVFLKQQSDWYSIANDPARDAADVIRQLAAQLRPLTGFSAADSSVYVAHILEDEVLLILQRYFQLYCDTGLDAGRQVHRGGLRQTDNER